MARTTETIVHLEDDISGGPAEETITFSFEGKSYEIDLNKANARKFRAAIKIYVEHARRAGRAAGPARRTPTGRRSAAGAVDSKAIRAWAASKKIAVPSRGRIPAAIIERYNTSK